MEQTGLELGAGRTVRSPAQLAESRNCLAYDIGVGVVLQRLDLIKRAGIADVTDDSHNAGALLRIAAAEVPIKFAQFAVVFAQLIQIDFDLIRLPAIQS